MAGLAPPRPLLADDSVKPFDCGQESLNRWLARHAWRNQSDGTSRTYVVTSSPEAAVAGYVALSTGQIGRGLLPKTLQRNKPDPIPILQLGQLAVATAFQGRGLGADLLQHAFRVTSATADAVGVFALATHPLNGRARAFYERWGFQALVADPQGAMLVRVKDLRASGF
jgi:ribosomal protein S18 acetylase RimI-like enzyme